MYRIWNFIITVRYWNKSCSFPNDLFPGTPGL